RVAQRVTRLFRRQGLQAGAPVLRDPMDFAGKRELDALIVIMFLFSGLGLVLSSTLVINTLSASVAEQIDEIGVIKALGGTREQIVLIYPLEAAALGLCGTVLGIALGALLGWRLLAWIASLGNATVGFEVAPEGLLLGTITGLLTSTLGGLAPALRGARLSIREALASYGIRSDYGQSWLDSRLQRLRRLPPLLAMAIRNLSRRTLRSVLTLLVISLAAASFLGAISTRDSVAQAISRVYETYASDAWVWLAEDVAVQFEGAFLTVEGVEEAEGWALANGIVGLSEARLWGIPPGSELYRQVMRDGRWYRQGEPDTVVLSSELADVRNLKVGDAVEIQAQGKIRRFEVVGVAIDHTIFLGGELAGKAFMSREALNRLLGRESQVSFFALGLGSRGIQATDEILADVERKFAHLRPTVQPVYAEIAAAEEGSRLLTIALAAMLIIVALVGSLGILNTMTLNVLERRREIAVIRAVGGSDLAVVLAFLGEGLTLGCLGWLVGLVLGYPAGRFFTGQLGQVLFALEFVLRPQALLFSLAFTGALAVLASLGPAIIAAHMSPSVALRYE
ncbi:MAG: FtsX-like permease family protein, partial [Anaerolineae bacterium]|nr:FtsX-like permease family protein [Anaerolineae bacterium]